MEGARPVRAPRGTKLTHATHWGAEAPLRMLMNNLDPENAERPDDLVVYGGTGRAARDWKSFDAMVRTLSTLKPDETSVLESVATFDPKRQELSGSTLAKVAVGTKPLDLVYRWTATRVSER